MRVLENCEPKQVFYYFEEICKIPHGSRNTKQISDYLVAFAKEHGFDTISTTLLVSPYQKHEILKEQGEEIAKKYGLNFLYRDFRVGFREGQNKARELGLYMQKYCGCVFSEEDRYSKQIEKDKKRNIK